MNVFAWRKNGEVFNEAEEAFHLKRKKLYENWVIFYFGVDLGKHLSPEELEHIYLVFRAPNEFPDAILVNQKTKEVLNIEFEEVSSGFKEHIEKHDYKNCDLVVCAEHDWDECPVDVYALLNGGLCKAKKTG